VSAILGVCARAAARSTARSDVAYRYREAAGLTQEELAERAGMSGVADLERGARTAPYPQTVRRLADALSLREHERTALLTARSAALRLSRHIRPTSVKQAFAAGTLPEALTSFIGCDREIAEVGRLLRGTVDCCEARDA
jgi:transcriptional regulator with XRE-family HTH domain